VEQLWLFDFRQYITRSLTPEEQLQRQWDASGKLFEGTVEFRRGQGFYIVPDEPRVFYDEGDLLGWNLESASDWIKQLVRE
jgi:hypothetical protein